MGAALCGLGTAVPERRLDNRELAAMLAVDEQWIESRTGIRTRHVAAESDTTTALATAASLDACRAAEIAPEEIDLVIVATVTPDMAFPATAALIQASIGATGAGAFDLNAGCAGFLYGLAQAQWAIASGAARTVLVCGADLLTRITDYSDAKSCVLFGDGAGAAVVREDASERLGPFLLRADGSRPELLCVAPDTGLISMDGREVYRAAVEGMTGAVLETLDRAGYGPSDVDLLVAHQANARILEAVGRQTGIPSDKVVLNISRYGNTSAASIPLALAEAASAELVSEDALVVITAFGAGFAWGAGLLRWSVPARLEVPVVGGTSTSRRLTGSPLPPPSLAGEAHG